MYCNVDALCFIYEIHIAGLTRYQGIDDITVFNEIQVLQRQVDNGTTAPGALTTDTVTTASRCSDDGVCVRQG